MQHATRLPYLLVVALLAAGCSDRAEAPDAAVPAAVPEYSARAFFETTSYGMVRSTGYAFSPDGDTLAIASDESGVFNAYELPLAGGEPARLTNSDDNAIFPLSFFPNDRRLLFTFDGGGNELNHVAVRETDGAIRDLTPGEGLKADFMRWSGDGVHFYLRTTERDATVFDVWRYRADDYSRELVFENPGFDLADISPDGRWVALGKPIASGDSDIYLVDLAAESPQPRLVTAHEGKVDHTVFSFTPDSERLVYSTDEFGEFTEAWSYELGTGEKRRLIEADWDIMYVVYSPAGRYRVSAVNADARTEVSVYDLERGKPVALPALPPGDLQNVRFSGNEKRIALVVNADNAPPNVHLVDLAAGSSRQLTDALNPDIDPAHLVESSVVRYESFDGLEIPSVLYRPHGASPDSPVPALVWVHGGPGGQSRTGYHPTIQHLVNHGYAVLAANNRGSSGYGKTFNHLDDRQHGEGDLQDIVQGRHYLASLPWVDGERIGIIGGSYGGYMVAAALAFEPEVFDVGVNIFGVTNWVRTLNSIPAWWTTGRDALFDELGDPATDEERLTRISPLFHAHQIVRPLLVVQGANDPRVLQVESDELVDAVRANEVPVEYVVFPDEGHGFTKRENRIAASEAYVRFLDTWLAGEAAGD